MKKIKLIISAVLALTLSSVASGQTITTVAGACRVYGAQDNVTATAGRLNAPVDVAIDVAGNLYVTDRENRVIRKVSAATGQISTIAGHYGAPAGFGGDGGPATAATLIAPNGIALDAAGNIYFTDGGNFIRKVSTSGIITRVAGLPSGPGYNGDNIPATDAALNGAWFLTLDAAGNIYFTDPYNHRVRKINAAGIITTIAGFGVKGDSGDNGPATAAKFLQPSGIAIDVAGNIYIADQDTAHRVRKINTTGIITAYAGISGLDGDTGDGNMATDATFDSPVGLAVDHMNNLYVSDAFANRVRKISPAGIITAYAGLSSVGGCSPDNGPAANALLTAPYGVKADAAGNLFIADYGNATVHKVNSILAVDNIKASDLTVYPNPSKGKFTFDLPNAHGEQVSIVVTNVLGEKVKQVTTDKMPIEIQLNQQPGIYMMLAFTSRGVISKKLIVE